eukprot:6181336-Pyramimonas_sp.AAC.1
MMTTKGPMPDPTFYAPLPTFDDLINWQKCTVSGLIRGVVCTDGSCISPRCEVRARAGWAFVMIDGAGATVAAASGPVPYPWQTPGAGEIWAATKALKHKSAGHITI